jgi:hypothetical protein
MTDLHPRVSLLLENADNAADGQAQRLVSTRACIGSERGIGRMDARETEQERIDVGLFGPG